MGQPHRLAFLMGRLWSHQSGIDYGGGRRECQEAAHLTAKRPCVGRVVGVKGARAAVRPGRHQSPFEPQVARMARRGLGSTEFAEVRLHPETRSTKPRRRVVRKRTELRQVVGVRKDGRRPTADNRFAPTAATRAGNVTEVPLYISLTMAIVGIPMSNVDHYLLEL